MRRKVVERDWRAGVHFWRATKLWRNQSRDILTVIARRENSSWKKVARNEATATSSRKIYGEVRIYLTSTVSLSRCAVWKRRSLYKHTVNAFYSEWEEILLLRFVMFPSFYCDRNFSARAKSPRCGRSRSFHSRWLKSECGTRGFQCITIEIRCWSPNFKISQKSNINVLTFSRFFLKRFSWKVGKYSPIHKWASWKPNWSTPVFI